MNQGLVFMWLLLSFGVAAVANARGRGPVGWFLLALVISPLIACLVVLVLRDERVDEVRHGELLEALDVPGRDPVGEIERLADLRDRGAITAAEFEAMKAELLGRA